MLWVWASSCLHLISAVGVILLLLLSTFKPLDQKNLVPSFLQKSRLGPGRPGTERQQELEE